MELIIILKEVFFEEEFNAVGGCTSPLTYGRPPDGFLAREYLQRKMTIILLLRENIIVEIVVEPAPS